MELKSSGLSSMDDVTFEQLMDEYEKQQSVDVEISNSPYDTESEIKIVMKFQPPMTDDKDQITFLGLVEEATTDNIIDEMADLKASADKPSEPLCHLRAEISVLSNKVATLESSLAKKQAIPTFDQRVQMTLQSTVPELICKPLNKELNALNTLEVQRFESLQKKLLSAIQAKVGKLVKKTL
ncbi:hypothetical protein Tco_1515834 [Tanacetum coccineum]